MGRHLQTPTPTIKGITRVIQTYEGGTGASTVEQVSQSLGLASSIGLGKPNGIAKLDSDGFLPNEQLPLSAVAGVTIDGPTDIYQGQTVNFTITNFDINTPYSVSFSAGTGSRTGNTITYTAPSTAQSVVMTINTRECVFAVKASAPAKPNITAPVYGAKISGTSSTLTSDAYTGTLSAHFSSDWQIATDVDFTVLKFQTINDTASKVSWTVTGLVAATNYIARVRYKAVDGTYGDWSDPVRFSTL